MTKPELKFDINLGTLIPLAAMAIAVAVSWGNQTAAVQAIERRMTEMETSAKGDDTRLRALETGQSTQTVRLDGIREALNELKASQRETNELLRRLSEKP